MASSRYRKQLDTLALQLEIRDKYPDLSVERTPEAIRIYGSMPISHQGAELDRFQIQVELSDDFPDSLPVLREVGGKIPWIGDRHMFSDGTCCTLVPFEWDLLPSSSRTILGYLDIPVRNFFLSQIAFEDGQGWPLGQREHSVPGVLDAYAESLELEDLRLVLPFLLCLREKKIPGHRSCPCGSGKIIRKCHLEKIRGLQQRVRADVAAKALLFLKNSVPAEFRHYPLGAIVEAVAQSREDERLKLPGQEIE